MPNAKSSLDPKLVGKPDATRKPICSLIVYISLRPSLSRRQRRRRFEDLYWCNVHINSIIGLERVRRREEKTMDSLFEEYAAIVRREKTEEMSAKTGFEAA